MKSFVAWCGAALLAMLFLTPDLEVEGAGTLFLILAVLAGVAAGYTLVRSR